MELYSIIYYILFQGFVKANIFGKIQFIKIFFLGPIHIQNKRVPWNDSKVGKTILQPTMRATWLSKQVRTSASTLKYFSYVKKTINFENMASSLAMLLAFMSTLLYRWSKEAFQLENYTFLCSLWAIIKMFPSLNTKAFQIRGLAQSSPLGMQDHP